ncbi:hypothetical protein DB32_007163 [Sandaracinus amylolyticus]|uniref:Metallohydrolase n=1 Tax=Sandaracinus amylolyticus TaxID=927083 RepID=A0A0F6SH87_9BACT|nr:hypothetical protein DB32_007163 [Sandaracinus amylolyticus]
MGTGDSATIAIDKSTVVQVDVNHLEKAEGDDDPSLPIVDELVQMLPKKNGRPYLSLFVLTHPDTDHCRGFAELQKKVGIGELWFTPRVFTEYKGDLGDDARAFQTEAKRRVKATIDAKGTVPAGDRVRIIGYHEVLQESDYKGFPEARLTIPGNAVTEIDGADLSATFRAFVHAPFKDDIASERNDSCVGLQISLFDGEAVGRALLFGDLCYPTVKAIFDRSSEEDLKWNILLAPHHCSKSVMFWGESEDDEEVLQQDLLDVLEQAAQPDGYVVVSSHCIPEKNEPGDNPPHAIAKEQYEIIAPNGVLCTMEYPNSEDPTVMVFTMTASGLSLAGAATSTKAHDGASQLKSDIDAARGAPEPSRDRVGFGAAR